MIKLFISDVDGTLTDGCIYISSMGECMKAFSVKDGLGIKKLRNLGVIIVIITGRQSQIVKERANELGITEIYQGVENKKLVINELAQKYQCTWNNYSEKYDDIAYIGDDDNDIQAIQMCKYTGCPEDASDMVKADVEFVATRKGGQGAVREFIEYILRKER